MEMTMNNEHKKLSLNRKRRIIREIKKHNEMKSLLNKIKSERKKEK